MEKSEITALSPGRRLTENEFREIREYYDKNREAGLLPLLACNISYVVQLIDSSKTLDADESDIVFTCYKEADVISKKRIENALFQKNRPLIRKVVGYFPIESMEEDILQEAMLAFYEAIMKFEPGYGRKFSSYAFDGMTMKVSRYVNRNITSVNVPVRASALYMKLMGMWHTYNAENAFPSREGFLEYACKAMDISREAASIIFDESLQTPLSLYAPCLTDSDDVTLGDTIACEKSKDAFDDVIEVEYCKEMKKIAKEALSDIEYKIVTKSFGLWGEEKASLASIGKQVGKCDSTISKIKQSAFEKLKTVFGKNGITIANQGGN